MYHRGRQGPCITMRQLVRSSAAMHCISNPQAGQQGFVDSQVSSASVSGEAGDESASDIAVGTAAGAFGIPALSSSVMHSSMERLQ